MPGLFDTLQIRDVTFRNRAWVSPMCQYSATDGVPNDWHLVHLGKFAVGSAGLVMTEATAVEARGRISPADTGIWNDVQTLAWRRIVEFLRGQGAVAGIQLAHAGRKASTSPPWDGTRYVSENDGGWQTVGASNTPFGSLPGPRQLSTEETSAIPSLFVEAAIRADRAGFDLVEIHGAHGYLIHEYLSPLANDRGDRYGGSFENRVRLLLEIVTATREVWPPGKPLFVRLSATDWVEGGWSGDDTVRVASLLSEEGADLIDCSSGGIVPGVPIPIEPGYQVEFARRVRREAGVRSAAVGLITEPTQADSVIRAGDADAVMMAREMLRHPHWPLLAAGRLDMDLEWPKQFARAKPSPLQ